MPVVALGALALAGYVTVKRALDSTLDEADVEPAIDVTVIESAVEENGLGAITETETLDAAINDEELDREVDMQRLQSAVEEKLTVIEERIDAGDIESVLGAAELDAVTRGVSAITEQEVIEGTIERDEVGVTVDVDELRSVLDSGTAALERTTETIAETIGTETDGSVSATDDPAGTRIAVVDEQGRLESLVEESDTAADSHSEPAGPERGDDRTDGPDPLNEDRTDEPSD